MSFVQDGDDDASSSYRLFPRYYLFDLPRLTRAERGTGVNRQVAVGPGLWPAGLTANVERPGPVHGQLSLEELGVCAIFTALANRACRVANPHPTVDRVHQSLVQDI